MVDATDKFVMPGGIDSSTHFYRGEDGHKMDLADDWASGSKAAVSGENIFVLERADTKFCCLTFRNPEYFTCLLSGGTTTLVDLVMPERGENQDQASKSS